MFTLIETTPFPELKVVAKQYRHDCGMQVLSLETSDVENLFSLCFSTVPGDDTGVPHIIEHSVLEGSRAYPVKDPFVCMLKTSVATFINAMTYPDRTIYPCTSCCRKDYFNLFEVYWDAVYHPQLTRETFAQEGWHYEVKGQGARTTLHRNGIVLNEMSGYYSDPGTVLGRTIEQSLFGRTSMRYDSGGDPACIHKLTFANFLKFHRNHYNPAVTKVVLYGNIPTEEKLAFIEEHLRRDLAESPAVSAPASAVAGLEMPTLPSKPKTIRRGFVPDQEAGKSGKGIFALAWATDQQRNPELDMAFQLLEAVLFNNSGAPLKRAIQSSGLCSSIMVSGYDNETRYTTFEVALRGVRPRDFDKVEKLVTDTLEHLVAEGIPQECLDAALSELLLSTRSVSSKFVIDLLDDVCASWMYGNDPYVFLRQYSAPGALKEKLRNTPGYLEGIIRTWLLENPARVRIELLPDKGLKKRTAAEEKRLLAAELSRWSAEKVARVRKFQQRLGERALRPDSAEALATLPQLHHTDLEPVPPAMPYSDGLLNGVLPLRRGELFANGISRLSLLADGSSLPEELLPWLPLFAALFGRMGNARLGYAQMGAKCASLGVTYSLLPTCTISPWNRTKFSSLLNIGLTALDDNFAEGVELLREQCRSVDFDDRRRLTECLRECAAGVAASLNGRGGAMQLAAGRAGAGVLPFGYLGELQNGLSIYHRMRAMGKASSAALDDFCQKMAAIRQWLATVPLLNGGFVGSDATLEDAAGFVSGWRHAPEAASIADIGAASAGMADVPASGRHEFGQIPTQVSTCMRIMPAPHRTDADYAAAMVGFSMLSRGYMWDEVRAKGGAYGTGMGCDNASGALKIFSTDDPNPENTRRAFDGLQGFVESHDFTQEEVEKAILTCAGRYLRPFRPVGFASLCAAGLQGKVGNDECRGDYEALLAVKPQEVKEAMVRRLDFTRVPYNDFALGPVPVKGTAPVEIG